MKTFHIAALLTLSLACGGIATDPDSEVFPSERATITGSERIEPEALDGLTLKVMVDDSTATTPFQVTFHAAESEAEVLNQINAKTLGRITASASDGLLVLTADEPGEDVQIGVFGGTALPLLGIAARTYSP